MDHDIYLYCEARIDSQPHRATAGDRGKTVDPKDLPDDDAGDRSGPPKEVPIGRPVSPDEFERMKKKVPQKKLPPGDGQADPSGG